MVLALLGGRQDPQAQLGEMVLVDPGRRVGQRIGARLGLWEGDALADVLLAGQDGRLAVHAEGEAGVVRRGSVVMSLRAAKVQIAEAFGREEDGELWLDGLHISPYSMSGEGMGHDPDRPKKLLLHRAEIRRIVERMNLEGLTQVPLRLYLQGGNA